MVVTYAIILVLSIWGIGLRKQDSNSLIDYSYLSKDATNSIKGLFILTVFVRHANQYVRDSGYTYTCFGDQIFLEIDSWLGQLIVVAFLLFSGYGVMRSINSRGIYYVNSIPVHRFLNTLLNFDIAVLIYGILALVMGRSLDIKTFALSLIAWEDLGNSNWYIFVILACYFSTWLSFKVTNGKKALLLNLFFIILIWAALVYSGKLSHWYNTIIAYPLGMALGYYQKEISEFNYKYYFLMLLLALTVLVIVDFIPVQIRGVVHNIRTVAFSELILLIMMKSRIQNKVLGWFGINLFILYIYQRIPMIVLSVYFDLSPFIFIILSVIISCLLVPVLNKIQLRL